LQQYTDYIVAFLWYSQLSSIGQVAENLPLCSGNATILYNKSQGVWEEYERAYYEEAGYSTYRILKSVDPIIVSCYKTVNDYGESLVGYADTLSNGDRVVYNMVHNLGSIYDLTEEGYYKIVNFKDEWDSVEYWKRMGIIVGTNFQNILETPEDYFPYSNEDERFAEERDYSRYQE
jgi:hypothetical protein